MKKAKSLLIMAFVMMLVFKLNAQTDSTANNLLQKDSLQIQDSTLTQAEIRFRDSIAEVNRETQLLKESQEA